MRNKIFISDEGYLKYPFSNLYLFYKIKKPDLSDIEKRSIENIDNFIINLMIICSRLKNNLQKYKIGDWRLVNQDELFLDSQSFFLFIKQFLEDSILILRTCLPSNIRNQLSPKFSEFMKKPYKYIVEKSDPFIIFINNEKDFFADLKDFRDDISHGTSYDKNRTILFPDKINLWLTGGNREKFHLNHDLKSYLSLCIHNIFSYIIYANDYIKMKLKELYNNFHVLNWNNCFILPNSDNVDKKYILGKYGIGTLIRNVPDDYYNGLSYFIK